MELALCPKRVFMGDRSLHKFSWLSRTNSFQSKRIVYRPKVLPIKIINWNLITKLEEEKKLYRNRRCVFKRSFLSIEFQRNSKILTRRWNDLARTGENWKMILGGRVFSFLHPYHPLSRSRETRQLPPLPFFLFSNTSVPLKSRIFHSQVYVCATNRVVILWWRGPP